MLSNAQTIMNEVPPVKIPHPRGRDIGTCLNHEGRNLHVLTTMINHQNAMAASVQTLQSTTTTGIAAQTIALANTETALRAENEALKLQLTEATTRFDAQINEAHTESQQLRTYLQSLTLANREMQEQLAQLTSRFNELGSNSFFASSRATEVGDDDDKT